MKCNLKNILLFCVLIANQLPGFGNDGKSLFIENCAICHTIGKGKLIGPDLKNIQKIRSLEYFQAFVKSSQAVIKSGDSVAVSVYEDYDETIMPEHSLSNIEIDSIWQFIQTFEGNAYFEYIAPVPKVKTSQTWIIYLLLLILLVSFVILKRKWLYKYFETISNKIPITKLVAKRWKSIGILIVIIAVLIEINHIGIFTGYQPKQPILFSHEVHCTQNKITCRYCHYEAYKGQHGGIPPLSTCMNCHKYVNKGTLTDTLEIAKLYDWAGFDFKTKEYNREQMPLGWVKVYNLPDHARFNHHIHTNANISCNKCHGNVEEMKEIRQATSLTMKWCVDCHTKSNVPLVGYYSEEETNNFKAMSADERANFTLRSDTVYKAYKNMGGLDCYKCHN